MSAGSKPSQLHPLAAEAMLRRGLDIKGQNSKSLDAIEADGVAVVVTLCAEESCPTSLHRAHRLQWPMPDPAASEPGATEAEQLGRFLDVADRIAVRLSELDVFFRRPPSGSTP
jgi:arsenate reductase